MKRRWLSLALLVVPMTTGACTQFQAAKEVLSPVAPTELPNGSNVGSLTGVWATAFDAASISPQSCKNFQWIITSQSPTAVTGSFTAECGGGLTITANASGTLVNPTTASITVSGNGVIGVVGCQFNLNGTGHIVGNESITINYTGTTCFGPVSGTETLRRPAPPAPPPPPPSEPSAPPPPDGSAFHVGPGGLDESRAKAVIEATASEFPHLLAPFGSEGEKRAATDELLHRIIWHLQLAGFQAGRQRNPSSAISLDKVTIAIGGWRSYDILTDWDVPGRTTKTLFIEVFPPSHIPNPGLPD